MSDHDLSTIDYNIHGGRPRLDGKHNRNNQLLLQGAPYDNFVNTLKSPDTLKDYDRALKRFMQHLNITDVNNLLPPLIQNPKQKIIDYILYLKKERGLGGISIASYVAGIVHFYAINDITLNRKRISAYIPPHIIKKKDRGYSLQEIARLLQFCDVRDRAVVLLFASTGMRIGAVPDLKLQDLKKIEIEQYNLYRITVYSGAKEEYICFCTPEAAAAINEYLQYRERCGETLTDDSPLFREQFDITDLQQIKKKPTKLTANAIVCSLRKRLNLAGILSIEPLKEGEYSSQKRKPIKRTHGFRKFVTTVMIDARLNETRRYLLLGKSLPRQDDNYYRPKESDLLEEYLKVVDALTINEENRLKRNVEELTVRVDKLDELEEQMNRLTKKLGLE
jgi:integrase